MRIGIIGSGSVGGTLGSRWAANGHSVVFSSRNPNSEEMKKLVGSAGPTARTASVAEAAAASEVILVATPWPGTRSAIESAGSLGGKIVIDATNPLKPRLDGLELGTTTSAAEQVAGWAHGARVVKAFNTVGYNIMADPRFPAAPAVMFCCGDDPQAKQTVVRLAEELGFQAVDAGPLTQARLLEPFALLWITLAYAQGQGREIAFQLMKR